MHGTRFCAGLLWAALLATPLAAQPVAETASAPVTDSVVWTRAKFAGSFEKPDCRVYVQLKIAAIGRLPFSTQTFRLRDRSLLEGIGEGASVKFTARHADGENTVTAVQVVEECKRFQKCD